MFFSFTDDCTDFSIFSKEPLKKLEGVAKSLCAVAFAAGSPTPKTALMTTVTIDVDPFSAEGMVWCREARKTIDKWGVTHPEYGEPFPHSAIT
jgi:hypothetical protein